MSVLGIRASTGGGANARQVVKQFFKHFAAGRVMRAKKHAASDFVWFGKEMDFGRDALASWISESSIAIGAVRELSDETLREMPKSAVVRSFGGPVHEGDKAVFADVTRGDNTSTIIAIVATQSDRKGGEPVLRRVVDPAAFVRFTNAAAVLHHM